MPQLSAAVEHALNGVRRPTLVLLDPGLPEHDALSAESSAHDRVVVADIGDDVGEDRRRSVVVVTTDTTALRAAGTLLAGIGRTSALVVVTGAADRVLTLRPMPEWPGIATFDGRLIDGAAVTRVRFTDRVRIDWVVAAFGRAAASAVPGGPAGLWFGAGRGPVPPVDPSGGRSYAPDDERPVDVLLHADADTGAQELEESPVTGRAPVVVADDASGPPGGIDEAVYNPIGFGRFVKGGDTELDPTARLSPALVAELRAHRSVRIGPHHGVEVVAGLAMAGVPLVGTAPTGLDPALAVLITDEPDRLLQPAIRREALSVRLRRSALRTYSVRAWRHRTAAAVGARAAGYPEVSVLLATKRPHQLDHALAQLARQRLDLPGAAFEVVLAAHGFSVDAGRVAAALGPVPHRIVERPEGEVFGDVLSAAVAASSGRVLLKVDDDDWYGPEVIADLLLARHYSGAPLVGMPAEQVYVGPADVTVRRKGPSENYTTVVAGGTLMIDRDLLREAGGFRPVRRFVDAQLLDAVRAMGAPIYRTHGLGYVLCRTTQGHTWDPGVDYFLDPAKNLTRWPGLTASELMEMEPTEGRTA